MRPFVLVFTLAIGLRAEDARLQLALRAQTEFDRVDLASPAHLAEATACVQSQAALLPLALPEEVALIEYRRGYCTLVSALITHEGRGFEDAARAFERASASWPARPRRKGQAVEPVSPALGALAVMSRLAATPSDLGPLALQLAQVKDDAACPANLMSFALCHEILRTARLWRGWIAVEQGRVADANADFDPAATPGWSAWVEGRQSFDARRYSAAASAFQHAVQEWRSQTTVRTVSIPRGLAPPPDLQRGLTDLGSARLANGELARAIAALDEAARLAPTAPWPVFLRGRARELSGDTTGARADFNLASRTAFAGDASAGDAHFYRGIWLYRQGRRDQAEQEFESALNGGANPVVHRDVEAWRALTAVAGGSCGASRENLARALDEVSPFFPAAEARAAIAACLPDVLSAARP